jgi:AraC-like DNA-binding protein
MAIYAPATSILWNFAHSCGIEPEKLFRDAGIDPSTRNDPNARVPRKALDCLIAAVYKKTGDITYGIKAVQNVHPSHLGPLGYAWMTSASLGEACQRLERFSRIVMDRLRFSHLSAPEGVYIRVDFDKGADIGPMNYLFNMALFVQMVRLNLGNDFKPLKVCMSFPKPIEPDTIQSHFQCTLDYDAPLNQILISHEDWQYELPRINPELALMHDEIAIRYLARVKQRDIINQVKTAIFELLGSGNVTAEDIAKKLHITPRTLRRRLDEEDASYGGILKDLRQEMAMQYIRDDSMPLTEISYLLGFSQLSSLSRALRLWTGKSPTEIRQEALYTRLVQIPTGLP